MFPGVLHGPFRREVLPQRLWRPVIERRVLGIASFPHCLAKAQPFTLRACLTPQKFFLGTRQLCLSAPLAELLGVAELCIGSRNAYRKFALFSFPLERS